MGGFPRLPKAAICPEGLLVVQDSSGMSPLICFKESILGAGECAEGIYIQIENLLFLEIPVS